MDEDEIEVVELGLLEGAVDEAVRVGVVEREPSEGDFRREEDGGAGDA